MISYYIKLIIKKTTNSQQRQSIRKLKRHLKSLIIKKEKTTLHDIKKILTEQFGIKKNDKIFVTSSFGNLNADFSPQELINLLMEIVGKDGIIVMPYYPPMNSTEWARQNNTFDMDFTKSGMGILTNVFSQMPNVIKSTHPTKALCIWGKNAESIASHHEFSTTPYYKDSPYSYFYGDDCKSIGLGCKNMPMIHSIEDILSTNYTEYYQSKPYNLTVINKERKAITVKTYIHDDKILSDCMTGWDYAKKIGCKSLQTTNIGYSYMYIVNNLELLQLSKVFFSKGKTRIKSSWK